MSAGGPGIEAGRVEAVVAVGLDRQAQPIGEAERDHDRVERVVAVGPPADDREGQVELGRGEPDDRRERGRVGIGHPLVPPPARVRADLAERLEQREPLPDREGLGPPIRGDPGGLERGRDPGRLDGELPRQDVVEHLAALAEARLDEPPERVLGVGVRQPVVARVRLDDDHGALDGGLRLEGRRPGR